MKDYRVEVKVKNNYLFRLMDSYGLSNAAELSRASGCDQQTIGLVLNLKIAAINKWGKTRPNVQRLCTFFTCEVCDLFPPQHLYDALQSNSGAMEANMAELASSNLLAGATDPLQIVSEGDAENLVAVALGKLSSREVVVMNARFGLQGEETKTYAATAALVGVSVERCRQIELKALRKLKGQATASLAYAHSDSQGEDREKAIIENAMTIAKHRARAASIKAQKRKEFDEWCESQEKLKWKQSDE